MKPIEQLTPQQLALLPTIRDHWLRVGLSTDPIGDGTNPYYWAGGEDDPVGERNYERWEDSWGSRVRCCVRGGMNITGGDDMCGVIGFSVGDLRRMYGGQLPQWVLDIDWTSGPLFGRGERTPSDMATAADREAVLL